MFELICEIRKLVQAAKTRSRSGRCAFTEDQRLRILLLASELEDRGFQPHDASEMLGMQVSTLKKWQKEEKMRTERVRSSDPSLRSLCVVSFRGS